MSKRYLPQVLGTKAIDREKYQIRFVLSSPNPDRHDEVVDQKGWKLENYLKNPVVLFGHDQSSFAVGQMVELGIVDGNLEGVVQFAYKENPDAQILFELYAGGYMRAGSVGFGNLKWMFDEVNDRLTLLENELYEFSLVNVPANADALAKAYTDMEAKGMDKEVLSRIKRIEISAKKDEDRFKDLGEKIEVEKKEEGAEVTPPEEVKPVEEVKPAETAVVEPPKESNSEEVAKAIEVLCRANATDIKSAVEKLTSQLKDADNKSKVDNTPVAQGRKNHSVNDINRVIRLLASKRVA